MHTETNMKKLSLLIALGSLGIAALVGCSGSEVQVTKQQENDFRNPPKEIPPESLKAMQKSREEGMRRAEEMRAKAGK